MIDEFLTSGNSLPSVKLSEVGDMISGKIIAAKKLEDKEMNGEVRRWSNGDPKFVWVFDIEINGEPQALWVRGNLVTAIREAASTAKITSLVGCKLTVKHHALGEVKTKGYNAPKLYKVKIEASEPSVTEDDFI